MHIKESGENYLETILILQLRKGSVRSVDIANELGYSQPSISRAVSILKNDGCIEVNDAGIITFTDKGRDIAESIYSRHRILTEFLVSIGVSENTAAEDACRIEHDISDESFEKIKEALKNRNS